jgi:hypothetical protein
MEIVPAWMSMQRIGLNMKFARFVRCQSVEYDEIIISLVTLQLLHSQSITYPFYRNMNAMIAY